MHCVLLSSCLLPSPPVPPHRPPTTTTPHHTKPHTHTNEHRWHGDNGPRPTDLEGPLNLIQACPKTLKRFVFVTSAGVERQKELPWAILNTFGEAKSDAAVLQRSCNPG